MTSNSQHKILIWVQHLLGVGHLYRAVTIAKALSNRFNVVLVSGGMPLNNIDFGLVQYKQLPPLRATDETFSILADDTGQKPDDSYFEMRRHYLLSIYEAERPDMVITEMYPFGRRKFKRELESLLYACVESDPQPLVCCSVRDILTKKEDPSKSREMSDIASRYYSAVFVHGDPSLIPFDISFPETKAISKILKYTGYISNDAAGKSSYNTNEVIVSTGGGAVGEKLLTTAIRSKPLSILSNNPWRILLGPNISDKIHSALYTEGDGSIIVEPSRSDFPEILQAAKLSISQAGYNTVVDSLKAQVQTILVPFSTATETEQSLRAQFMQTAGLAHLLHEKDLTPQSLSDLITRACESRPRNHHRISLDGASQTLNYISGMLF